MGYVLILLFFLIWLNVRKIRKTLVVIAKDYGYKKNSLFNYILDVITDYSAERKHDRNIRNHTRKLRKLQRRNRLKMKFRLNLNQKLQRVRCRMIKILNNLFFAFLADIFGYYFLFAIKQSFDLKIFVVAFFFTFLVLNILDFIDYIYAKRFKNEDGDDHE